MIEFIKGDIVNIGKDYVILNHAGMGYFIVVPATSIACFSDSNELPYKNVTVFTHLKLSEDSVSLYGFSSELDRELFRLLISVNKVGPKAGISILSILESAELVKAVLENNYALISKAPGIGVKTAQKIILELKDRIAEYSYLLSEISKPVQEESTFFDKEEIVDTIEALISLGYSRSESKKAVKKVLEDKDFTGQLLAAALKHI